MLENNSMSNGMSIHWYPIVLLITYVQPIIEYQVASILCDVHFWSDIGASKQTLLHSDALKIPKFVVSSPSDLLQFFVIVLCLFLYLCDHVQDNSKICRWIRM